MARELTADEQQELDTLRATIEQAIADGILTPEERQQITTAMRADGKVTYEELALVRQLVCDRVASGQLKAER